MYVFPGSYLATQQVREAHQEEGGVAVRPLPPHQLLR